MQVSLFIENNYLSLEGDIARGNGETLVSFSKILGCRDFFSLSQKLKANYIFIYPQHSVSAEKVGNSIIRLIQNDLALKQKCVLKM